MTDSDDVAIFPSQDSTLAQTSLTADVTHRSDDARRRSYSFNERLIGNPTDDADDGLSDFIRNGAGRRRSIFPHFFF